MPSKDKLNEHATAGPEHDVHGFPDEPLMHGLKSVINGAVRLLAILMTLVIVWGVLDVLLVLVKRLMEPPIMRLQIADILATFGSFMAVLIAIEIFVNITIYLRDDIIHVKIVMATALMASARKVIILNVEDEAITPQVIFAIAALVLATSIGYFLVVVKGGEVREVPKPGRKP